MAAAAAVGQVQLTVSAAATCCQLASKSCWLQLSTDSGGGGDGGHGWSRVLLSWNMTSRSGERERERETEILCVPSSSIIIIISFTCPSHLLARPCLFIYIIRLISGDHPGTIGRRCLTACVSECVYVQKDPSTLDSPLDPPSPPLRHLPSSLMALKSNIHTHTFSGVLL